MSLPWALLLFCVAVRTQSVEQMVRDTFSNVQSIRATLGNFENRLSSLETLTKTTLSKQMSEFKAEAEQSRRCCEAASLEQEQRSELVLAALNQTQELVGSMCPGPITTSTATLPVVSTHQATSALNTTSNPTTSTPTSIATSSVVSTHQATSALNTTSNPTTSIPTTTTTTTGKRAPPKDCSEVAARGLGDGVYELSPGGVGVVRAQCSAGYTTFQRRQEGNTSFNRDLSDYSRGFGDPSQDYWLGLEALHALTVGRSCEFRAELQLDLQSEHNKGYFKSNPADGDGRDKVVSCTTFGVGAGDGFRLNVSGCSSDILGSWDMSYLLRSNGRDWTTRDRDRDDTNVNCASYKWESGGVGGAWWYYDDCTIQPNTVYAAPGSSYCSASNRVCAYWGPYFQRGLELKLRC